MNTALFRRYGYDSRSNLRDRIRWDGSNFGTQQAAYDGVRRLGNQGNNLFATSQCPWYVASGYLCPLSFQQTPAYDAGGNRTDVANAAYATGNRVQSFRCVHLFARPRWEPNAEVQPVHGGEQAF